MTTIVLFLTADDALAKTFAEMLVREDPDVEVQVTDDLQLASSRVSTLRPDVLIVDMDALPADHAPKKMMTAAPTIVLDGVAFSQRRSELLRAGAVDYVPRTGAFEQVLMRNTLRAARVRKLDNQERDTTRHYRDILGSLQDGIFILVGGAFSYVNEVFAASLELNAAQAVADGVAFVSQLPGSQQAQVRQQLSRLEVSDGAPELVEFRLPDAAGGMRTFEARCHASVIGGRRAIVGVARDVTRARRLSRELQGARQRAAQVERLRALGEISAGVAHDVNNSLGAILGRIKLACSKLERGENPVDDLRILERASRSAAATVARILEFSRPMGQGAWRDVNLSQVVREAAECALGRIPEGMHFDVQIGPTPNIRGHRAELLEAVVNLLYNALDACSQQPTPKVGLTCTEGPDATAPQQQPTQVLIRVQDNGPGIPDDVREHIFEPFFSTKGARGTGLGLSVTQWILRRHDAQVDVRSNNDGTVFELRFTCHPDSDAVAATADVPVQSQESLTVLVVDDEASVAEMVRDALNERGHQVAIVRDATAAKAWAEEQTPAVVLTDLDLPDGSGWTLARELREMHPSAKIGLMTGWPLGAQQAELRNRGIDFLLSKPFTIDALEAHLTQPRP